MRDAHPFRVRISGLPKPPCMPPAVAAEEARPAPKDLQGVDHIDAHFVDAIARFRLGAGLIGTTQKPGRRIHRILMQGREQRIVAPIKEIPGTVTLMKIDIEDGHGPISVAVITPYYLRSA